MTEAPLLCAFRPVPRTGVTDDHGSRPRQRAAIPFLGEQAAGHETGAPLCA